MDVTINILGIGGVVVLTFLTGYFWGRKEKGTLWSENEEETGEEAATADTAHTSGRSHPGDNRRKVPGRSIASPVEGRLEVFAEGGRKGVVIEPGQGLVYAPMAGKITRLYPMGNALLLRSNGQQDTTELLIRVGRAEPDELCSMYFRSHVVQNEIINKGKLLLEFDREGLLAAGEAVGVTVCPVEGMSDGGLVVTAEEYVKVGEKIFEM